MKEQIKAMLDGTATMVEPDLFYTGGTLILIMVMEFQHYTCI